MSDLKIFINGNVPSSKNGKRWTGKYLIHSKTTMRYIKDSKEEYLDNAQLFRDYVKELNPPYVIHFCFYRKSKRKFDYVNPLQTVQDLMVKYNWIEDDNADFLLPIFDTFKYDNVKPGVLITIKKNENEKTKKESKDSLHKTARLSKTIRKNNKSNSNKRPRKHKTVSNNI